MHTIIINIFNQLTRVILFFTVISSSAPVSFAQQTAGIVELKVIRGVSSKQRSTDYFDRILTEALANNKDGIQYRLTPVDFDYSQNKTLKLLNLPDVLDITYSMSSRERELQYIAIKVPLLNGLYGKRRLLVPKVNKAMFETMSLSHLKSLLACQGLHWPDYKRLKMNGFSVYGVEEYKTNFKMLLKGRCDYLPRGIAEIDLDYKKYNAIYGEMAIVDNILFEYNAPIYFFVGQHQSKLAQQVEAGLLDLKQSGRLSKMLSESKAFQYNAEFESNPNLKTIRLH